MNIISNFYNYLNDFFHLFDNFLQIIYQFDVLFGIIFIMIALYITFFSYKIYIFSKENSILLFGFSFFLFALADIIKLALDLNISFESAGKDIATTMSNIDLTYQLMFFTYMMLMISGYIMLALISFKVKHKKIYSLLFLLILSGILISSNHYLTFKVFSIILIGFLLHHYYKNNCKTKTLASAAVFSSFIFIMLSEFLFLFLAVSNKFYLLANVFRLFAYLLLLFTMIFFMKKR